MSNLDDGGQGSLRDAISMANNMAGPDEITFSVTGTVGLTSGELEITDTLTINGPGRELLTIDAKQNSRVLNYTEATGDLQLARLKVTGGRTDMNNNFMDGIETTHSGGGIRFMSDGILTLTSSLLTGNGTLGSHARGGGVFMSSGDISLINSEVHYNFTEGVGSDGGGVHSSTGDVTLLNSVISSNRAERIGGNGGGIRSGSGSVNVEGSTINDNFSGDPGGGISASSGNVSIVDSTISGNSSISGGGGIRTSSGDVSVTRSSISGNRVSGNYAFGGGIRTSSGSVTLTGSTVSGNSVAAMSSLGGGVFTFSGNILVEHTTISGNISIGDGGGLVTQLGHVQLDSSTVLGNIAAGNGGGIFAYHQFGDPGLAINNSIVAANVVGAFSKAPDIMADPTGSLVVEFSLIGDTSDSGINSGLGTGNRLNVDPLLGPLVDNGGPTKTHALLPSSPAIDTGDPSVPFDPNTFDQRGAPFHRVATGAIAGIPINRIDIGAYEAQVPPSADFVEDDIINGADFLAWQRGFGLTVGATQADGDSDYDNDVDASDLAAWVASYGQLESPPPPVQVVVAAQPAVSGEDLIDAALALGWFRAAKNEESRLVAEPPIVEEVLGASIVTDRLASAAPEVNELAAASADSDVGETDKQPWLTDELLEWVFG